METLKVDNAMYAPGQSHVHCEFFCHCRETISAEAADGSESPDMLLHGKDDEVDEIDTLPTTLAVSPRYTNKVKSNIPKFFNSILERVDEVLHEIIDVDDPDWVPLAQVPPPTVSYHDLFKVEDFDEDDKTFVNIKEPGRK